MTDRSKLIKAIAAQLQNSFCPTGPGGGVDPTCGKGEVGSSGSSGSGASIRAKAEEALGTKFSEGTSKTIGNKTSVLHRATVKTPKEGRDLVAKIGASMKALGMSEYPGRSKTETVWGTKGAKHVVRAKRDSNRGYHSVLVEVITDKD